MNTDDLVWQVCNYGGLAPRKVDRLLGHGHLPLVIRTAEERGEWFCAERAAQELCRSGEFGRALKVMEPFVATGWPTALWAKAGILLRAGRTNEALDLVRPDQEGRASRTVCRHFAELLAEAGRVDEAVDLLVPHIGEPWIRTTLVEITEGRGRDERVLELISPYAEAARRARDDGPWDCSHSDAQELQARVLERAGRAAEAIRILGEDIAGRRFFAQNTLAAYAELLALHGLLDELRELATGQDAHAVLHLYADALRDRGRAVDAETAMRDAIATDDWVGGPGFPRPCCKTAAWTTRSPSPNPASAGTTAPTFWPPSSIRCSTGPRGCSTSWSTPSPCPITATRSSSTVGVLTLLPVSAVLRKRSPWSKHTRIRGPTPASSGPASSAPPVCSLPPPPNCGAAARSRRVRNCSMSWSSKDRRSRP
ncbi:tetratricopeptide repeat protein [Streptomyces fungicidicus]|uniref:tetratricopeptide repeat protein n=1 Tax=Streptomyces fungicidicus TaxID=68203 RepID=UPI00367A2060